MKNIAVIFAGGTGQRMGGEIPKQFLKVYGKEIIIHTLERFDENDKIDEIYIACVKEGIEFLKKLIKKYNIKKVKKVFAGGKTGQESIFFALKNVKKNNDNAIVLIHDGVRPLVDSRVIKACIDSVIKYGSGITVTPCFETPIYSVKNNIVENMPPRENMYTAQAPQCFYLNDIYSMHLKERKNNPNYNGIVDSCNLMFKNGIKCHMVIGNRGNIKVTTPEDYCTLLGNYSVRDYQQLLELSNYEESNKVKK